MTSLSLLAGTTVVNTIIVFKHPMNAVAVRSSAVMNALLIAAPIVCVWGGVLKS